MEPTLFERIISRDLPSEIVYEDEYTLAFLDINPVNPGHTLVVPKTHSENIYEIGSESWAQVMETVRILAPKIKEALGADGINIMMNNDEAAGQMVYHTHVHIIPRFPHDGFKHWPGTPYEEGKAGAVAERIRAQMAKK